MRMGHPTRITLPPGRRAADHPRTARGGDPRRQPLARRVPAGPPQPERHRRRDHRGGCSSWSPSSRRSSRRTPRLGGVVGPGDADQRAGAAARPLARARPVRVGHVDPDGLRRPAVPGVRRRVHRHRPDRRRDPGPRGRRVRAVGGRFGQGSTRSSCARRRHAVDPEPAPRGQHRRRARPERLLGDDRHRGGAGADLRAAAARIDAGQGRSDYVLAAGALGLRKSRIVDEPRAAQQRRADDRAGHAQPRDRDHRGGGAVLPRPRRVRPRHRRVGADAGRGPGPLRRRAPARHPAGVAIAITALGFTLFGEALREALDPRTRR